MKFSRIKTFFNIITITFLSDVSGAELSSYSIDYIASANSAEAEARRSFSLLGDNIFQLSNHLEVKIAGQIITKVEEISKIKILQNSFTPINYSLAQSGLIKDSLTIDYDWEKRLAMIKDSAVTTKINLEPNTFDQLSHQVALQHNFSKDIAKLGFSIINKDKIIEYNYRILGEERIITPLGQFNSTKLERVYEKGSRQKTFFWLASDLNGILLRMDQTTRAGINIILEIQNGTLNGVPIMTPN